MGKIQVSFTIEDVSANEVEAVRNYLQTMIDNSQKPITLGTIIWQE